MNLGCACGPPIVERLNRLSINQQKHHHLTWGGGRCHQPYRQSCYLSKNLMPRPKVCSLGGTRFVPSGLYFPRFAIRGGFVNPQPRYKAPGGCPPHGSLTSISLPSPGSPRYRFPCFIGTMKMCDSQRPSHRASFPSLGDTRRRACRFAPSGPERTTAGLGFVIRSPTPDHDTWRRSGPPKVPGEPECAYALFSDPGEPDVTATRPLRQVGTAPRTAYGEGSPREVISGLHHTASALAVYASQCGFRRPTQDSLLAAGQALPDGIGYPQGSYERFSRCYSHRFPLPQASWRKRCPLSCPLFLSCSSVCARP
jgi:hypothetical protein